MTIKVAVIVGSNRTGSINKKLAHALTLLKTDTLEYDFVDITKLPMYNQDLESSRPAEVNEFTTKMASYQAVLMVTPEHNRSIPAVLKNAIDWGSKPADKNIWGGKPTAIAGTSPGAIGTAAAQEHLRHVMTILGAHVMGGELYLTFKPDLIDDAGTVTVEDTKQFLQKYVDKFSGFAAKLAA